jgi:hypothetical protein
MQYIGCKTFNNVHKWCQIILGFLHKSICKTQLYHRGRLRCNVIKLLVLLTDHNFQHQLFIYLMHMAQFLSF